MSSPFMQALSSLNDTQNTADNSSPFAQAMSSYVDTSSPQEPTDPWSQFKQKAVKIAQKRNFPSNVILGQAALESGRGTSNFAKTRHNYFGYNAIDADPNQATQFSSDEDAINKYIDLVMSYPGVKEAVKSGDPNAVIYAIEAHGYASDPNYVQKVSSTPEYLGGK